ALNSFPRACVGDWWHSAGVGGVCQWLSGFHGCAQDPILWKPTPDPVTCSRNRCMRSSIVICTGVAAVLGASLAPRSASAQQGAMSGVAGSVVDSIHGGIPLQGAVVRVNGPNRQATTDANGRFQIDSVPPGEHSLSLIHPLLDTLGIAINT